MLAIQLRTQGPIDRADFEQVELPTPQPGPGQLSVKVLANGACRTDLHLIEGDLPLRKTLVVPGHQIVGIVDRLGDGVRRFKVGDRVGAGWLNSTCGECTYCRLGSQNLCDSAKFTGWDVDGGYAEYAVLNADFAFSIPDEYSNVESAPLLCGGVIGYRALTLTDLQPGDTLGLYGFGSSAHMIAQVALHQGLRLRVYTRGESHRQLAMELGAEWAGDAPDGGPNEFDGAIIFAPAGELVPQALASLRKGGTLTLAGIHMGEIPPMDYSLLYGERIVRSVANFTSSDAEGLLRVAAEAGVKPRVTEYALSDTRRALIDLKNDRVSGSAVIVP